jgi:predicted enzyme related to lactoylglutathione lyase
MEWRVLHAAQHGSTNTAIASSLGISADGVKYHMANILGKLNLPNKRALKTWFQAPRNSALAQSGHVLDYGDAQEGKAMSNKIDSVAAVKSLGQVSRTVRSLEESIDFYQQKLGIPYLYSFGSLGFLDIAGSRLFLNETKELNKDESILYFKVDDIVKTCTSLEKGGVEITNQPHLIHTHEDGTEEWMAFLNDPEGRSLGLMSTGEFPN